ncbi:MAG: TAXI family TRAP transporter solute-binding subunit [Beijerinckiaceae bacterium]
MRKRSSLLVIAVVLAIIGLGFSAFFLSRLPRTLTIAVGPAGFETHRYVEALAQAGVEARERIRLKVVTTEGAADSARLLDTGKVDLAIIRSDFELPANGQTILVNTKRAVVILAPQRRNGIQKFSDLKGKRIAVVRLTDPNIPLVQKLLAVAEIGESDATLIESEMADLPELLGTGKVDAAIAIVVPTARNFTDIVPQIARRLPGGLRIVPMEEAQTASSRIIGVEPFEIPAGAFGTGRPREEVQSVAISYRTMARKTLSDDLAGRTAKSLYDLRTRVSRMLPIAYGAEPPDAKTGARIPVHPGAMAYFDGETKTMFERYGDVILSVIWGSSLLGSGLAGFIAWVGRKNHGVGNQLVEEITKLTTSARTASAAELAGIEARGDEIVATLANLRQSGKISDGLVGSASLALDHFRSVVESVRGR